MRKVVVNVVVFRGSSVRVCVLRRDRPRARGARVALARAGASVAQTRYPAVIVVWCYAHFPPPAIARVLGP
eukprot:6797413-Lingulodinium_polyedra.AAC.1